MEITVSSSVTCTAWSPLTQYALQNMNPSKRPAIEYWPTVVYYPSSESCCRYQHNYEPAMTCYTWCTAWRCHVSGALCTQSTPDNRLLPTYNLHNTTHVYMDNGMHLHPHITTTCWAPCTAHMDQVCNRRPPHHTHTQLTQNTTVWRLAPTRLYCAIMRSNVQQQTNYTYAHTETQQIHQFCLTAAVHFLPAFHLPLCSAKHTWWEGSRPCRSQRSWRWSPGGWWKRGCPSS